MKYLLAALFLVLSSCAFDSDNNRDDKRNMTEREKLIREYSEVQGVYQGQIIRENQRVQCAQMIVTYVEKVIGRDDQGRPQFRPALIARLSRPELVVLDIRLDGDYVQALGDMTFRTADNSGGEDLYIRGSRNGEIFEAPIKKGASGGNYGFLSLRRISTTVPSDNREDLEQYERIRNRLKAIAGVYDARFESKDGSYQSNISTFRIDIQEDGSVPKPVLSWRRTEFVAPMQIPITYYPDLTPEKIYFSAKSLDGSNQTVTFNGDRDSRTGTVSGDFQFATIPGQLIARPQVTPGNSDDYLPGWCQNPGAPTPTPTPNPNPTPGPTPTPPPAEDGLLDQLRRLEGSYKAQFVTDSGNTTIKLETFRLQVDTRGSTPKLMAYWKSPRASSPMEFPIEYSPSSQTGRIAFSTEGMRVTEEVVFSGNRDATNGNISGKMSYRRNGSTIKGTFRATR